MVRLTKSHFLDIMSPDPAQSHCHPGTLTSSASIIETISLSQLILWLIVIRYLERRNVTD